MEPEAFSRPLGDSRYAFSPLARGPWDPNSLHARFILGLMGHELDTRFSEGGFHCSRITIDLYRLPTLAEGQITTKVIRDGNRIRVIELEYLSEGTSYARANAVLLKQAPNPDGDRWSPPSWDVPAPETLPLQPAQGETPADGLPVWDVRPITAWRQEAVQGRVWLRDVRPLVQGVPLTPLVRAAVVADFTNPLANMGTNGLQFINADITLYLHRYPQDEWLGFNVTSHQSDEGIAVGDCTLYDRTGPIGHSLVCAVANRKMGG